MIKVHDMWSKSFTAICTRNFFDLRYLLMPFDFSSSLAFSIESTVVLSVFFTVSGCLLTNGKIPGLGIGLLTRTTLPMTISEGSRIATFRTHSFRSLSTLLRVEDS